MKNFKLISIALVICMFAALVSCFAVNAEQASDYCIADLRFSEDNTRGNIELNGAHIVEEDIMTGAVTIELDSASATINMVFAENFFKEGDGGNIYYDCPINVKDTEKHPYFVFDYASADDVVVSSMIAHYTRKDKAATSALGDLYLNSMMAADYASYQVGGTECNYFNGADGTTSTVAYGIWDWGKYVTGSDAKIFDDGIHRFCDVTCTLTGSVGKRLTFYKFGVYSTTDDLILQLGSEQPEPTPESGNDPEDSSEPDESGEPEAPVLNVIKPSFNTTISAGSMTIISKPADGLAAYNVKWAARILLAPTETAGVYTVVEIQTPDGTEEPTFSKLDNGYILLAIHGDDSTDTNSESVQIRNAWMALEAGTTVTFEGYDFEALTIADDATVSFEASSSDESSQPEDSSEPEESSEPDESETSSEEPVSEDESSKPEESKTEEAESGSFPWWIIVVVAVVVIAVVVFIVIKKKK